MTPLITTETIGIEILMAKAILTGAEDGMVTEARDIVTRGEGENGTLVSNTMTWATHNNPNILTQITIAHLSWVININTQSRMNNIHIPSNSSISHIDHQCNHVRVQSYVNCVRIKAITIINASLQAILWRTHKKLSIKVTHITTKTLIKESGQMGTMTIMTPMGNLFSNGCH